MLKIGIVPNTNYDIGFKFTREIAEWLKEHNAKPYLIENEDLPENLKDIVVGEEQFYDVADFLLVLGGDGTILHSAYKSAISNVPIMGINIGNLGYLTDVDKKHSFDGLHNLIEGNYVLEKRMMLTVSDKAENKKFEALNEISILRGSRVRLVSVKLSINDEYIDTYRGDGVLISTPTGSTAYNLSAGGPILKPDGEMIAITQVAPHTLYARPFVVPSSDIVTVENAEEGGIEIFADGHQRFILTKGNAIYIKKSKYYTTIVKTHKEKNMGFYDVLREKLNYNTFVK